MSVDRPFIVIEGVDGSGKTTVGQLLAERLDAVFFQTPSGWWRQKRSIVEEAPAPIRFIYYLLATIYASIQIKKALKQRALVCDRYLYSTWAHHIANGCRFLRRIPPGLVPVVKPDHTIYLTVNPFQREQRIQTRPDNTASDLDSTTMKSVNHEFTKLPGMIHIDTTHLCPAGVVDEIIKRLNHY